MSVNKLLYAIAGFFSLVSPIIYIFCASELSAAFDDRKVYYTLFIMLTLVFLSLNGLVMFMAAKIPKGQEKTGCLLLVTAVLGFFSIMFWVGYLRG